MTGFLRSALVTTLGVTLVGGAVALSMSAASGSSASSTVAQQVDGDELDGDVDGGLLEAPVHVGPGTAVALLDSLTASYSAIGLPATQRVVLTRDPFRPVVPRPAVPGETPTDPGDPSDPSDPANPGGPGDPADPSDPTQADACAGDEGETVCDGRVVTLDGFDGTSAIVTVDGVQFMVNVGDEFATSFRVLATNAPCATLLYGDESFSICTGVTVLK